MGNKAEKPRLSKIARREERAAYLFLLPNFIGIVIFVALPVVLSLMLGFADWNPMKGITSLKFAGLEHFADMLHDKRVIASLKNNLFYTVIYVPSAISIALVLAGLLNKYVFGKVPIRLMCFMPSISSMASVAFVWLALFHPTSGPINAVLASLGVENLPQWLVSTKTSLISIVIISVWHDAGYYMIILLASMKNIPGELYESASMDGAGGIRSFFWITVPVLASDILYVTILATINSFKVFEQINILTQGGPGYSTNVLVYTIYHYAFKEQKIGYASAISVLLFIIVLAVSMVQMRLKKRFQY